MQRSTEKDKIVITSDDIRNYMKRKSDLMTTLMQKEQLL